mmetsp:Transcript_7506/g.46157  ORF Transcript_7506/g.46157 Transcript_7506/m.46157 type:complete len:129 (+) Transcript_7506:1440-1826(+)
MAHSSDPTRPRSAKELAAASSRSAMDVSLASKWTRTVHQTSLDACGLQPSTCCRGDAGRLARVQVHDAMPKRCGRMQCNGNGQDGSARPDEKVMRRSRRQRHISDGWNDNVTDENEEMDERWKRTFQR